MSGGRFNYVQYRITDIIDDIEEEIKNNDVGEDKAYWVISNNFKEETIEEFRKGIDLLKKAQIYAQRIDWLLCGDDGEDNFHKRLIEDLSDLNV